jgi:hypothetical protein
VIEHDAVVAEDRSLQLLPRHRRKIAADQRRILVQHRWVHGADEQGGDRIARVGVSQEQHWHGEILRSGGIAAVGPHARRVRHRQTRLGGMRACHRAGRALDDAVFDETDDRRVGFRNHPIVRGGDRVEHLRPGVRVGDGDQDVFRRHTRPACDLPPTARHRNFRQVDDIVGDHDGSRRPIGEVERAAQERVMHARAVPPHVGVTGEKNAFRGRDVNLRGPGKQRRIGHGW